MCLSTDADVCRRGVDPLCGNKFGEEGNTNMKSSSSSEVATLLGPVKPIQVVFGYVP